MGRPYVIEEDYRSGAIKIYNTESTNPKVVNRQRIKHYISGMPINVETNIIQTMTPEEHIKRDLPEHSKIVKKRRYVIRYVTNSEKSAKIFSVCFGK